MQHKQVLLISPEPWSYIFVSKHHYAMELVRRGHRAYFLNPPDPRHYKQLQIGGSGIENLYLVNYPGQLKGMRFLPAYLRRSLDRKFLQQLESLAGSRMDIIWNFENSRFYDLGFAGDRLKIYQQVDLNQAFHIQEAAASADICFCTSDLICNEIAPFTSRVFKIHHGTSAAALDYPYSNVQKGDDQITALYIGNLDMPFLDRDLLVRIVSRFADVHFLFVGPYRQDGATYQACKAFSNVEWAGKVPAEQIPAYLSQADLFLVLYAEPFQKDQSSPHKFMEYFASGKVIVATYTDEYKDKRELLVMSDKNEEYAARFEEVIQRLDFYNASEKQAERIAFAKEHSYQKQLEKINAILADNGMPAI